MAEGLFRHAVKGKGDFRGLSAGVGAINGQTPSAHAITALNELGIDIAGQRSRMLNGALVQEADYIFGMTRGHVEAVTLLYPQAEEKTFVLREFDETLDFWEKDIADPIGGNLDVYLNCRDQIEQGIESMLRFVERAGDVPGSGRAITFALGADHGGFQLKEALKHHLEQRHVRVVDFGTNSAESTDYPDYAKLVAQQVAEGKGDFGLLCCSSGIGMSITANKVPGVRAALVFSEDMATVTRQHNDANVLCLGQKQTSLEEGKKS